MAGLVLGGDPKAHSCMIGLLQSKNPDPSFRLNHLVAVHFLRDITITIACRYIHNKLGQSLPCHQYARRRG